MNDEQTTYEVHVICDIWTVNAERRMHWGERSERVSAVRWAAKIATLDAKIPHLDRVEITVQPMQARGVLADPSAHEPAAKAAIDGLRDARIIDNDTGDQVAHIKYLPPIRTTARAVGLILTLTPVQADVAPRA